ncbi:hypothetical protein [Haloplanus salilacus]|uniref:hypothetical protein n=1 Tax=Haloplanus salilacus TaxID=2949994 RepID=UPI0030D0A63E
MDSNTLVPLIFLYTNNRASIDGATRFQKLVFLAQEEDDIPDAYDDFRPDRFGPFSKSLHHDLEVFRQKGYIERNVVTNEYGQEKHIYSLSERGIRITKELIDDYKPFFDVAESIKGRYNSQPLPDLLKYVYRKYEGYRTATEIDTASLFDPDAKSEFEHASSIGGEPKPVAELLQPTPHTLYQLPKRDTNAYIYYFTDSTYSQPNSKYKQLDDQLTLLGRHRQQLEVVIIDRDRTDPTLWKILMNGLDIDDYPAIVVAGRELGVGDVTIADSMFTPTPTDYATLENGMLLDDILRDVDETRDFLNGLYDAALTNSIQSGMRKEKVIQGLSIGKDQIEKILTIST